MPNKTFVAARVSALALALTITGGASGWAASAPKIERFPRFSARTAEHGKYPPEMVAKGQKTFDGSFLETALYKDAKGAPLVRVWESGPGVLQTDGYPYDEYCNVLEGRLEIVNASGGRQTFGPGDTFVIPKGWRGTWNMKTRFRKQYIELAAPQAPSN